MALNNLAKAFKKEKSKREIERIAHDCFENFGRGMVDCIYVLDHNDLIPQRVKIEGKEYLDDVLKKGKGAIFVGAHFGNFLLMYFRMVLEGYSTNVIMKRTRDHAFEQYIAKFRDEIGLKTIYDLPARQCVQRSIKALRSNELLFILLDQNYGTDGRVFVDFFGQKAATATGPVVFARRTQSPVLPIFIQRDTSVQTQSPNEYYHKIVIKPAIEIEEQEDEERTIEYNIAKITKVIENHIREYPHEWGGWMHNRWKSRTIEEQIIIDLLNEQKRDRRKILEEIRA